MRKMKNMPTAKVHEIGPACEKYKVEFTKEGAFWVSKIKGSVVLTYKQEGACKRNMERHLTAHNGYYAKLYD
jgi:hypothetical protein